MYADLFDYIVVGAGTAGCVLANRLTASGRHRVLLLEAGGHDRNIWIHVPLGYGKLFTNPKVNWLYTSEPEAELNNRRIIQPRGKVLGGSSSINGLLYIRGQPSDFDHWRQLGNSGWSFDDVLPHFRRAEDQQRGEDALHGVGGPLAVSDVCEPHPLCAEVILAGGTFNSPQLLQLSGLGPAPLLQSLGINVIADMPGVGADLQDHLQVRMQYRCTERITMNDVIHSWRHRAGAGLRYALFRKGLLAIGAGYAGGFFRTSPQVATPDVQVHFIIFSADAAGAALHAFPGFIASVCQLRPESRGFVRITSADPAKPPAIEPRYLSSRTDRETVVAGMKLLRWIMRQPAMRRYIAEERAPSPACTSDAELR